ncbi:hypothetical protein CHLNCDRAFT_137506 [Chlorella variabilis]|uniref:Uncharacterized protein n=1 Tax=Chlorella variabilis TaxID=554065 RepID=E1ZMK9_CHLVA|nr:hypothetical protein CHLNCDRAFT_137506 [Chlorella variabilis]EFN53017.1 hypothetical protein CHLNCDRAFT_137506 [Chlorella variabilis]|eukprot:XP_005845119.1 hypothetical protein CHLNCDRAFT_137506 [Chlorella variabilis]
MSTSESSATLLHRVQAQSLLLWRTLFSHCALLLAAYERLVAALAGAVVGSVEGLAKGLSRASEPLLPPPPAASRAPHATPAAVPAAADSTPPPATPEPAVPPAASVPAGKMASQTAILEGPATPAPTSVASTGPGHHNGDCAPARLASFPVAIDSCPSSAASSRQGEASPDLEVPAAIPSPSPQAGKKKKRGSIRGPLHKAGKEMKKALGLQ